MEWYSIQALGRQPVLTLPSLGFAEGLTRSVYEKSPQQINCRGLIHRARILPFAGVAAKGQRR